MIQNNFKINDIVLMLPVSEDIKTVFNNKIGKIVNTYRIFGEKDIEYKWIVSFNHNGKNNSVAFSEKYLLKLSEK